MPLTLLLQFKKYLIPIAVIAGLAISAFLLVNGMKKASFREGQMTERSVWLAKKAEAEAKNREFEYKLKNIVEKFGAESVEKAAARISRETVYLNKVETIIKDKPIYQECKADQDIIDSRNAIRTGTPSNGDIVRVEF